MNCRNRDGYEPKIDEVLADPIIRLVMAKDGVSEAALRGHIGNARLRLAESAFAASSWERH